MQDLTVNISPLLSLSSFPFFVFLALFRSRFYSRKFLVPVLLFMFIGSLRRWTCIDLFELWHIYIPKFQLRLVSESLASPAQQQFPKPLHPKRMFKRKDEESEIQEIAIEKLYHTYVYIEFH